MLQRNYTTRLRILSIRGRMDNVALWHRAMTPVDAESLATFARNNESWVSSNVYWNDLQFFYPAANSATTLLYTNTYCSK